MEYAETTDARAQRRRIWAAGVAVFTLGISGCADGMAPIDGSHGNASEQIDQRSTESGRYDPPQSVKRAGENQEDNFSYVSAGDSCSGHMLPGADNLGSFLVATFDGAAYYQGYNCRTIRGGSSLSMHGTGRAVDVFIPTIGGDADNSAGDPVANYLIRNATALGMQFLIWDRSKWSIEYAGPLKYNGTHPHYDHLHIELTPDAARNLSSFPSPGDCAFSDVCGSTFEDDIAWLKKNGYTHGCGDGRYCPDEAVTRGQLAAFFVRVFDLSGGSDEFDDDDGHQFENAIDALAAEGITNGCAKDKFCPDDPLTRGQAAAFFSRVLSLPPSSKDHFHDDDGSIFEEDINALAEAGITAGCGDGHYCPDRHVRRGPFAAFLHRGYEYLH